MESSIERRLNSMSPFRTGADARAIFMGEHLRSGNDFIIAYVARKHKRFFAN